jgi:hypothetical protein
MEVCSVVFDPAGAPQMSGPVAAVTLFGAEPAAAPEGYSGAVRLGPDATLTAEVDPGLVTPDLALELVLKLHRGEGGSLTAGGLGISLSPVESRFRARVQVPTSGGTLDVSSSDVLSESWQRWVVAYTGLDVLFCLGDQVSSRTVLASWSRVDAPTLWEFGGSPLTFELAAIRWHASLPPDLEPSVAAWRARGDGELKSLAERHPEFAGISDLQETLIYSSRKVSHPEAELIWHHDAGAHILTGPIRTLWREEGEERGQLGYPLTDVLDAAELCREWGPVARPPLKGVARPAPFVGTAAHFEGGVVVAVGPRPIKVSGEILVCWRAHGGTLGLLGAPREAEAVVVDGLQQQFDGGTVFWQRDQGAHAVFGATLAEYERRGGPATLGFPVAEQAPAPDGGALLTCFGGTLLLPEGDGQSRWMSTTMNRGWADAVEVVGAALGDEVVRPSGVRVLACANGVLVSSGDHPPLAVTSLSLTLLDAFVPEADDGIALIGWDETAELMVRTTVEVDHRGARDEARDVAAQETGDPRRVMLGVRAFEVGRVDETTSFRIRCQAWDHDTLSANDELGGIEDLWNIDNEWGLRGQLAGVHESEGSGGDGTVRYRYTLAAPGIDPATVTPERFRERLWWSFDNFATQRLDRDLFTETFEDVAAMADLSIKDALVEAFFGIAFTGAARGGNCYGMSREALLGLAGRAPWRPPLSRYGPGKPEVDEEDLDPVLRRALNSSQGSQLGAALVAHLLRMVASGIVVRPESVYETVAASVEAGHPMLLSMFSLGTGEGHAVVAYSCTQHDHRRKTIHVADPNTPSFADKDVDWRSADSSRIDIQDGAWQYYQQGGTAHEVFRGPQGPAGVATLMPVPLSVIFAPVRTPLSILGFLDWLPGGLILMSGATTTSLSLGSEGPPPFYASHIHNLSGLRNPQGSEVTTGDTWMSPSRLQEVYGAGQATAPGLFRVPFMQATAEAYGRTGRFPDHLAHSFTSTSPMAWQLATDRHRFAVSGTPADAEPVQVDLASLQSIQPRLALSGTGAAAEMSVSWSPGTRGLPAVRTTLPIGPGVTSRLDALLPGRGVQITPGTDVPAQVLDLATEGGPTSTVRLGAVRAGTTVVVQPRDLVSPVGDQIMSTLSPEGVVLERVHLSPTA